jgi:hypothetical protein
MTQTTNTQCPRTPDDAAALTRRRLLEQLEAEAARAAQAESDLQFESPALGDIYEAAKNAYRHAIELARKALEPAPPSPEERENGGLVDLAAAVDLAVEKLRVALTHPTPDPSLARAVRNQIEALQLARASELRRPTADTARVDIDPRRDGESG